MIVRATNGYQALSVSQVLTILKHFPWHYLFKSLSNPMRDTIIIHNFQRRKLRL